MSILMGKGCTLCATFKVVGAGQSNYSFDIMLQNMYKSECGYPDIIFFLTLLHVLCLVRAL